VSRKRAHTVKSCPNPNDPDPRTLVDLFDEVHAGVETLGEEMRKRIEALGSRKERLPGAAGQ